MMKTLMHDLRLALRGARSNLAFSAVVVLTLGLGIGANSTIFSAIYGLVINPFPFPEPDRIVGVGTAYPKLNRGLGFFENLSPLEYVDIREQSRTLEEVVAWDMGNRQIAGEGPRVLVVDDDASARDLLRRALQRQGFSVTTAGSGEEGLRLARELRPAAITIRGKSLGQGQQRVLVVAVGHLATGAWGKDHTVAPPHNG